MAQKITATGVLIGGTVLVSDEKEANSLYQKGFYGDMKSGGRLSLSLVEACYLIDKEKSGQMFRRAVPGKLLCRLRIPFI